jgi:hypothetical protein
MDTVLLEMSISGLNTSYGCIYLQNENYFHYVNISLIIPVFSARRHIVIVPKLVKAWLNGCEAVGQPPHNPRTKRHTDLRLNLILPKVEPNRFEFPKKCPQKGCPGMRFIPRQAVSKKIVDAQHPEVTAWRCECIQCGHVFRVYPKGVSQKQISKRVNGMAVMMYILGKSYGAVEIVLNSLGVFVK